MVLCSIAIINLPSTPGINYIYHKSPVVHSIDNAIWPHSKPEQIIMALEPLNIAVVWQSLDSVHDALPLIPRQSINKFLGGLFDDKLVHHASPHSRLHSSSVNSSSFSGSFW